MSGPAPALHIRKAETADINALIALDTVSASDPSRAEHVKDWVTAGDCMLAIMDGEVVGYAVVNNRFYHRRFVEMLMVHRDHRRSGIGSALLEHVSGVAEIWTSTNQSNVQMQRLLQKSGFVPSGIIHNLDPDDPELVFFRAAP